MQPVQQPEQSKTTETSKNPPMDLTKQDTIQTSIPSEHQDVSKPSALIAEERITAIQQDNNIITLAFNPTATSENQNIEVNQELVFNSATSIGKVLSQKRQELGLSIEEIAQKIRLTQKQITALENDDLSSLPQVTFVRGFVRNYARAMGIDGEVLLRKYPYQVPEESKTISLTGGSTNIRLHTHSRHFSWKPLLIGIGLLIIPLAIYEIMRDKGGQVSPQSVLSNIQKSLHIDPSKANKNQQQNNSQMSNNQNANNNQVQQPAITTVPIHTPVAEIPAPPVIQKPVFSKDKSEIQLNFSGNSWVQVRDRDDKVLFSQMGTAGSSEMIIGKAPFVVLVGNTPNIKMTYNNSPVDLSSYSGAKVAKLKLN